MWCSAHIEDDELLLFSNILSKFCWWVKSVEYLLHNISSKLDSISSWLCVRRLSSDLLLTTLARGAIIFRGTRHHGQSHLQSVTPLWWHPVHSGRWAVKIVSWLSNNLLKIRTVWCDELGSTDSDNKNWLDLSGCQNERDIAGNE